MSVHYSSAVWSWRPPESSTKLVLLHLADMANHEGLCWPTQARICAETGLSKSTVNDKLNWLVARGIIARDPGNSARNTRYTISMEKLVSETAGQSDSRTLLLPDSPPTGPRQSDSRTILVLPADHLSPPAGHHPSVTTIEPPLNHQGDLLPQSPGSGAIGLNSGNANGATSLHPDRAAAAPQKKEGGRARDLCFEALAEIQGSCLKELGRNERGQINRALRDLREVAPQLTAEELKKRAGVFRERMPSMTLTAMVLSTWWSRLASHGNGHQPGVLMDAKPVVAAPEAEPEGWRDAGRELYQCETRALWPQWAAVPSANRTEILKALKKKKGGGDV
jgi:hypothetical protein